MAKQHNQFFIGRKGNIVYYKLNGGYYMRSMPKRFKLQQASKITSNHFTHAATAASLLRKALVPVIPFARSKEMQNAFTAAIAKWLNLSSKTLLQPDSGLPFLQNFLFNPATSVSERWKIALQVINGGGGVKHIHLPAFVPRQCIAAPAHTKYVECTITAAAVHLQTGQATGACTASFTFSYDHTTIPEQRMDLAVAAPAGSLVIVAVALRFLVAKGGNILPTKNSAFMPSEIIAAEYV